MSSRNGLSSDPYNQTIPRSINESTSVMDDNFVIPAAQIKAIIVETCRNQVGNSRYDHGKAATWNSEIITTTLNRLMAELESQPERRFKVIVNCTIAQAVPVTAEESSQPVRGTRGLHVANAAYWDPPLDGMFSYKFPADERRDFDVIVSVVWLNVGGHHAIQQADGSDGRPPQVVA